MGLEELARGSRLAFRVRFPNPMTIQEVVDVMDWTEDGECDRVARTVLSSDLYVSTLQFMENSGAAPYVWFESQLESYSGTEVAQLTARDKTVRYATLHEARRGHDEMVARVRRQLALPAAAGQVRFTG